MHVCCLLKLFADLSNLADIGLEIQELHHVQQDVFAQSLRAENAFYFGIAMILILLELETHDFVFATVRTVLLLILILDIYSRFELGGHCAGED